ncbi:MAG: hypothetical protein E7670_06175 [Ruminococcaceae bacterium]|nr:hypothetical protein [Oscillospiraceae bacterium]
MEHIYTIPVNEAFEASRDDASCGCPFCTLYNKLEENELELILGASMMEPDIRIMTNKEGFCRTHYDMMFTRKNRLGMALTLESHLAELKNEIKNGGFMQKAGDRPIKRISALEDSCYVCRRIEFHFNHMIETAVFLWDEDEDFREKFSAQPYFCLPHYKRLIACAQNRLSKKDSPEMIKEAARIVEAYIETLNEDVSWFCKKFDYRYDEEPWYNSKDSVERSMKFLRSDLHNPPDKKKK